MRRLHEAAGLACPLEDGKSIDCGGISGSGFSVSKVEGLAGCRRGICEAGDEASAEVWSGVCQGPERVWWAKDTWVPDV